MAVSAKKKSVKLLKSTQGARKPQRAELLEMDDDGSQDRKFVSAIARAFEILRAFKPGEGALGNSELAKATGLPKATVSRLTHTLSRLGYLNHMEIDGKYEPSPSILALGYCVLSNMRVRELTRDYMRQLGEHAGASVSLASQDRLSMVYVAISNGPLWSTRNEVGTSVPIENSAIGRAFLAGISQQERGNFYEQFARTHGTAWKPLESRIEDCIKQVSERGFCLVDGEWQRDTRVVAAPIMSSDGTRTKFAMNCVAPSFQISVETLENDVGPRLAHLCRGLAARLGA